MYVKVYRNLRNRKLSIIQSSRVVGYADEVILTDVRLLVNEIARQRCVNTKQKNVHAFVTGNPVSLKNFISYKCRNIIYTEVLCNFNFAKLISYNPYKYSFFYDINTNNLANSDYKFAKITSTGSIMVM
jgi:hypothetical protein